MIIKNIKEFGLSKGILKEATHGLDYFLPILKKFFNYFKLPFFDDCCNEIGEAGLPVGYKNSKLQYFNSITNNYEDIIIGGSGTNSTIPFYNDNLDAIMAGAAENSTYRLPYLMPGDYYPLALVGPLQLQTFDLSIPPNCNINTLSVTIQMTNTITNTVYNFTATRSNVTVSFSAITVTVLQGPYTFSIGPL